MQSNNWLKAEKVLKKSGVIVAPTDTLYGILAKAQDKKAVQRVYKIKGRNEKKPFIVLITSFSDLEKFGVKVEKAGQNFLRKFWPGKVSIILSCQNKRFEYLHRGTKTIAFRMVGMRNRNLYSLLKQTGPLVAPSANPQGLKPSSTIWEAKKYFGNTIDMYMCGGTRESKSSTLIEYKKNHFNILRKGAVEIKKD